MQKFQVPFQDVVEVCSWCIDNFGPSHTMPHRWRLEKLGDKFRPVVYQIELFEEADATFFALTWIK